MQPSVKLLKIFYTPGPAISLICTISRLQSWTSAGGGEQRDTCHHQGAITLSAIIRVFFSNPKSCFRADCKFKYD